MKKQIDTKKRDDKHETIDFPQKLELNIDNPYIDILFEDVEELFFEYEKYVNDGQVDLFIGLVRDLYVQLKKFTIY